MPTAKHSRGSLGPERGAPSPRRGKETKGETLAQRDEQPEPQLPHEHDESNDSHPGTADPRIAQASKDLAEGQLDTGRQPVVAALQKRQ
jgi:hypothetical protein